MSGAIDAINGFSAAWGQAMFRASWQGGAALVFAWALAQTLLRRSGRAQSWCWRLAHIKFPIALLVLVPLALPLLPAPPQAANPVAPVAQLTPPGPAISPPAAAPSIASVSPSPASIPDQTPAAPHIVPATALPPAKQISRPSFTVFSWLLMCWLGGMMICLAHLALAWRSAIRLRRSAAVLGDPGIRAACAALCQKMRLRSPPLLLTAAAPASPQLLGIVHPAILLPTPLVQALPPSRLSLILAHELAHLQRRDLFWNALHWCIDTIFFFHPLLWLARRPVRLAQELACDERALTATSASPRALAGTLLEVLAMQPSPRRALMSVGVADSALTVRRRLLAMMNRSPWSSRKMALAAAVVTLLAAPGLVPWRLVARAAPSPGPAATPPVQAPAGDVTVTSGAMQLRGNVTVSDGNSTLHADSVNVNTGVPITMTAAPAAAAQTVNIRAPLSGTIAKVLFKDQQQVKKGDMLIQLDDREARLRMQADAAAAGVASTRYQRDKSAGNALPASQIADDMTAMDAAKATQQADQIAIDNLSMRAPFDGTIRASNSDVVEGAFVKQGDSLAQLSSPASAPALSPAKAAASSPAPDFSGDFGGGVSGRIDGIIEAPTADIRAALAATLKSVLVNPGQQVKKGDVLFQLDNRDGQTRIALDEARVVMAQETLKAAQLADEKFKQGLNGPADPSVAKAQAELRAEQAVLEGDRADLDAASIRAPFDGTLTNFDLAPGVFIPQGSALAELVDTGSLTVSFHAPARDELKPGQKISLIRIVPGQAGETFSAEVTYVSPTVETSGGDVGRVPVVAKITGSSGALKPGMRVYVTLPG